LSQGKDALHGAFVNDALCPELQLDSSRPARLSDRESGAILPAVMTFRAGLEAAFEIILCAFPDIAAEIAARFWPVHALGPRPAFRVFPSLGALLDWLPQPGRTDLFLLAGGTRYLNANFGFSRMLFGTWPT
jgi:hypothetical protein